MFYLFSEVISQEVISGVTVESSTTKLQYNSVASTFSIWTPSNHDTELSHPSPSPTRPH